MKYAQPLLFLLLFSVVGTAFAQAPPPSTWVQHIIIVVQENRTPDSIFQDSNLKLNGNGADILWQGTNIPPNAPCGVPSLAPTGYLPLLEANLDSCFNPNHNHGPATNANGSAGGFEGAYDSTNSSWDFQCNIQADHSKCTNHPFKDADNYVYVNNSDPGILSPYFRIAENYGFANYMFQTNQGPSFLAHQFLFSGTSAAVAYPAANYNNFAAENPANGLSGEMLNAGCASSDTPPNVANLISSVGMPDPLFPDENTNYNAGYPCYTHSSLADLLASPAPPLAHITWKYYIQSSNYDNSIWTAPNALSAICPQNPGGSCSANTGNGQWANVDDNLGAILTDIQGCNLPQVSWVIPDGQWSDHPGDPGADGGPSWVSAIVNAVGGTGPFACTPPPPATSPYWANTVILVTWDDWGGFFDHIAPYNGYQGGYKNGNGNGMWYTYGFRVPLLVVSQYTQNYISGAMINGQPNENPPYVHDFGSILGFVEAAFNLPPYSTNNGANTCGIQYLDDETVGQSCLYPYADYFAADGPAVFNATQSGCPPSTCPYPLSDFFNTTTPRKFMAITGAKYPPSCFQLANVNNTDCFPNYPSDPDDE